MFLIIKLILLLSLGLCYYCTIDTNASELQYLADHLTEEECRRLVAAAHFKTYEVPNSLDQAGKVWNKLQFPEHFPFSKLNNIFRHQERKISKDVPCIDLLHHWNSQKDEGKGETHEALEHRLRQMGKTELADWLGKTVFRELAVDLNRSFEDDFTETVTNIFLNSTTYFHPDMGTLQAVVKGQAPSWTRMDTIMILAIGGLVLFFTGVCCKLCCTIIIRRRKRAKKAREERKKQDGVERARKKDEEILIYSVLETTSGSESEDRFDIRNISEKDY